MADATPLVFIVLTAKLFHMIFLWTAFSIMEKVALDEYVTAAYIDRTKLPSLWWVAVRVFLIDLIVLALIPTIALLAIPRFLDRPLVGGNRMVIAVTFDALAAWALGLCASVAYASVAQNQNCCRYADDGMRGIRAYVALSTAISLLLILPPYFLAL